jgi:flagellar operon protein
MASGLNFNNIQSVIPSVQPGSSGVTSRQPTGQPDFREALRQVEPSTLKSSAATASTLKFSNHAIERMQMRGIHFDPAKMESIQQAISKAAAKGAKNTLLLTDDSALIVSVKDNTVVTVMDRNAMKENVFTNIDSTVLV